ncbi:MAG TPA: hypothetical protein VKZ50_06885 [bacterium]|nr:hypothetical protein [bacterium]
MRHSDSEPVPLMPGHEYDCGWVYPQWPQRPYLVFVERSADAGYRVVRHGTDGSRPILKAGFATLTEASAFGNGHVHAMANIVTSRRVLNGTTPRAELGKPA